MTGTNVVAVKGRLVGESGLLQGVLGSIPVFYDPPKEAPREYVCGDGDVEGQPDLMAMRGNLRNPRQEDATLTLDIRVYRPDEKTREAGDLRAAGIAATIINWITANPTLGDLPGLKLAKVINVNLRGGLDDDGATSSVVLTIGLLSVLH